MGSSSTVYKRKGSGIGALASCRGTAYVEYFILAAAMTVAAVWLWNDGKYQGAVSALQGTFDDQMTKIKGSVPIP